MPRATITSTKRASRSSAKTEDAIAFLKSEHREVEDLFSVSCRFVCDSPVLLDDVAAATHLFHITQEAVSNAARHGRATTIVVALRKTANETRLSITDDGCGLPAPAARSGGMGLRIMRYRAELIRAVLTIGAAKGAGTSVVCVLPNNP